MWNNMFRGTSHILFINDTPIQQKVPWKSWSFESLQFAFCTHSNISRFCGRERRRISEEIKEKTWIYFIKSFEEHFKEQESESGDFLISCFLISFILSTNTNFLNLLLLTHQNCTLLNNQNYKIKAALHEKKKTIQQANYFFIMCSILKWQKYLNKSFGLKVSLEYFGYESSEYFYLIAFLEWDFMKFLFPNAIIYYGFT